MKRLLVALLPFVMMAAPPKQALFNCRNPQAADFLRQLEHIQALTRHYEKKKIPYKIVLVVQGECTKFLLADTSGTEYEHEEIPIDVDLALEKISGKVTIEQCEATLQRKQIDRRHLRPGVKVTPSATVSIVDYQLNGYALVP